MCTCTGNVKREKIVKMRKEMNKKIVPFSAWAVSEIVPWTYSSEIKEGVCSLIIIKIIRIVVGP